jgi:hypothetical protein
MNTVRQSFELAGRGTCKIEPVNAAPQQDEPTYRILSIAPSS